MYRSNSTDGVRVHFGVLNSRLELDDSALGLPRVKVSDCRVVSHGILLEIFSATPFASFPMTMCRGSGETKRFLHPAVD